MRQNIQLDTTQILYQIFTIDMKYFNMNKNQIFAFDVKLSTRFKFITITCRGYSRDVYTFY